MARSRNPVAYTQRDGKVVTIADGKAIRFLASGEEDPEPIAGMVTTPSDVIDDIPETPPDDAAPRVRFTIDREPEIALYEVAELVVGGRWRTPDGEEPPLSILRGTVLYASALLSLGGHDFPKERIERAIREVASLAEEGASS
jgi:hypothetical protein